MRKTINEVKAVEAELKAATSDKKQQMAMISHVQGLCSGNAHYLAVLIIAKRRILRSYMAEL